MLVRLCAIFFGRRVSSATFLVWRALVRMTARLDVLLVRSALRAAVTRIMSCGRRIFVRLLASLNVLFVRSALSASVFGIFSHNSLLTC